MLKKSMAALLCFLLLALFCSAALAEDNRQIILLGDHQNETRNLLWAEDIQYLQKELPRRHKNLYHSMTKDTFAAMTDALIGDVDTLDNPQVFVRLGQIIAAAGDAHTTIDYWDGHLYPLSFWIFMGDVYIVDTSGAYEDMRCAKVLAINGVAVEEIVRQLAGLVPHENDNWLMAKLPDCIQKPVYMFGLGLIPDETGTVFTVEQNGEAKDYTVDILDYRGAVAYAGSHPGTKLTGAFDAYYAYEYMAEDQTLYLEYNVCADAQEQSFSDFCGDMFAEMDTLAIDTIVVDLRNNTGGNSEVFNAFTNTIGRYMKKHAGTTLYIAVGRRTFSSGIFALLRTKKAVPEAVVIGEATGGALDSYGDTRSFTLPNSQLPVTYCTKNFQLAGQYHYTGDPAAYAPEIAIEASIADFCGGMDPVMEYIRAH